MAATGTLGNVGLSRLPFSRSEFTDWHEDYSRRILKPASAQIERSLGDLIEQIHAEDPRGRVRLGKVRIKSVNRAWAKLEKPKYADRCSGLEDVPTLLDDLLGVRIVCTNREDVEDFDWILSQQYAEVAWSPSQGTNDHFLGIEAESRRDYVAAPKQSGYRAFHLNLITVVGMPGGTWKPARAELQVRTLLQDAWGELTHEDTYKPDSEISEFVETLSLRMAEMLAVLDDLAQDLRHELDQRLTESVDDISSSESELDRDQQPEPEPEQSELREAVHAFVTDLQAGLKKPMPLATVAYLLQQEFGEEITRNWLGYLRMAPMLQTMLPEEAIVTDIPGLLVPTGFSAAVATTTQESRPVPPLPADVIDVAQRLKTYDSTFPLLSSEAMRVAYDVIAQSHNAQRAQYGTPDIRYVNQVTKLARDLAEDRDARIARSDLNYICHGLLIKRCLDQNLTADAVAGIYTNIVIERFRQLQLLSQDPDQREAERTLLRDWLNPALRTNSTETP